MMPGNAAIFGRTGMMVIITLAFCSCLHSQDREAAVYRSVKEMAEASYGPDQVLVNGEKYYYPYRGARGTPFLEVEGQDSAFVRIRGKEFPYQKVRYDIYGQLMVLDYRDQSGAQTSIILPMDHLEDVIMGAVAFRKYILPDGSVRPGQEIHGGPVECVCFWDKQYRVQLYGGEQSYYFTDPRSSRMILAESLYYPFRGNRSFLKAIPEKLRPVARDHLRSDRIRVRRLNDAGLHDLMEFINRQAINEK